MVEHKLIDIQNRLEQPIASATGLPNERYISEAAFQEDRDKVIAPTWACIAFVEDLPQKNYAFPLNFMGLPLVITRDNNDIIRVFHNVCSHRGMMLNETPCKTNGMLKCPYHAWTYALDGTLRGTPHIGGYGEHKHPDFDRSLHGLKTVRSEVWLGAVFVNLSGNAIDFSDYIAPLTQQFDELCSASEREKFSSAEEGCRTQLTVKSNWKLPVENYLESYHLPTVHPELNRVSPLNVHYDLDRFENGGGQASANYSRTVINNQKLPAIADWKADSENVAVYPVLYPNTLLGVHADHLFIMFLQPTAHDETVEHVRISYLGDAANEQQYQAHRQQLLDAWTNVFGEDIFAVERMQQGRFSPAYAGGAFSPAMDIPTLHFHRWVAKQLVQNTKQ